MFKAHCVPGCFTYRHVNKICLLMSIVYKNDEGFWTRAWLSDPLKPLGTWTSVPVLPETPTGCFAPAKSRKVKWTKYFLIRSRRKLWLYRGFPAPNNLLYPPASAGKMPLWQVSVCHPPNQHIPSPNAPLKDPELLLWGWFYSNETTMVTELKDNKSIEQMLMLCLEPYK